MTSTAGPEPHLRKISGEFDEVVGGEAALLSEYPWDGNASIVNLSRPPGRAHQQGRTTVLKDFEQLTIRGRRRRLGHERQEEEGGVGKYFSGRNKTRRS